MTVSYGSLFSGVGGFDLGCDAAGWQCGWQVEWDKKAASVLKRHWPDIPKWSDVSDVNGAELPPVDVITFGFPCQDLSVAGQRAGFDGERSVLFFEAMRIINEMRSATGGKYPRVIVAENVVGLLSADGGVAMGRCLDEMAQSGALEIEWRVLDAQHFGVPQRRRRVFVVARYDNGNGSGSQVFVESEGSGGSVTQGNKTRQDIAATLGGGSGNRGWSSDTDRMTFVPIAFSHTAGINPQPSTDILPTVKAQSSLAVFVKARRAQSVDDHETWETDRPSPTLNAFDNAHETRATVLVLPQIVGTVTTTFGPKNYSNIQEVLSGSIQVVVAPTLTASNDPSRSPQSSEVTTQVAAVHAAINAVRRLTPRECERLQGWPDDHTRWDADGKENADGPRYKMIGNGVAAPVAEWLARQIGATL